MLGDGEIDIRPVTEPWDIGMTPRPEAVTTRRYMVLRKATTATEAGAAPTPEQRPGAHETDRRNDARHVRAPRHRDDAPERGEDGATRIRATASRVFDGPFVESKELIAGYVIVSAASLDAADGWVMKYLTAVEADEVDLRELE